LLAIKLGDFPLQILRVQISSPLAPAPATLTLGSGAGATLALNAPTATALSPPEAAAAAAPAATVGTPASVLAPGWAPSPTQLATGLPQLTRWDVPRDALDKHYMPLWSHQGLCPQIITCAGCGEGGADCGVRDMWDPATYTTKPEEDPLRRSEAELDHELAVIHTVYVALTPRAKRRQPPANPKGVPYAACRVQARPAAGWLAPRPAPVALRDPEAQWLRCVHPPPRVCAGQAQV